MLLFLQAWRDSLQEGWLGVINYFVSSIGFILLMVLIFLGERKKRANMPDAPHFPPIVLGIIALVCMVITIKLAFDLIDGRKTYITSDYRVYQKTHRGAHRYRLELPDINYSGDINYRSYLRLSQYCNHPIRVEYYRRSQIIFSVEC